MVLFALWKNIFLKELPNSASGMDIFENFYFFSTNPYILKIGHLLFRAQYFRIHFGLKCVRWFFYFDQFVVFEQIDECVRKDGFSFSKTKRKNKKSMCAASYLLASHQCHKRCCDTTPDRCQECSRLTILLRIVKKWFVSFQNRGLMGSQGLKRTK